MSSIVSPRVKEVSKSAPSRNIERINYSDCIPSRIIFDKEISARKSPTPKQDARSQPARSQHDARSRKRSTESNNTSEVNRRLSRIDSVPAPAPARRQGAKDPVTSVDEAWLKDVMFLRKMLAINKKQEMMLNKRLARLLEEEEFQTFAESKENKHVVEPPPPPAVVEVKAERAEDLVSTAENGGSDSISHGGPGHETSKSSGLESSQRSGHERSQSSGHERSQRSGHERSQRSGHERSQSSGHEVVAVKENPAPAVKTEVAAPAKVAPVRKVEYDINGRRVYYYSDIEKDTTEDESDQKQVKNDFGCKSSADSIKMRKRGSACSKKTFTVKKSLTYINSESRQPKKPEVKSKRKVRPEEGDSTSRGTEKPLGFELRPKKAGCQGDGQVQNVVVHCSTVYRNSSTSKNNIKVWNYESLPNLKPEKSLEKNKPVVSDERPQQGDDSNRNRHRPISLRNNNIQIKFKNPPRTDERSSTVETVFLVHNKFSES